MYLVTGGGGFIGSHLVEALVKQGERVRVLDNFSTGRRENLQGLIERIDLIEGDIRDPAVCRQAVQGVRYVLHQAALPRVPRSIVDPLSTHEVNATGTLNLLIAARDAKLERFVYASSSSVYGESPSLPKVETMAPSPLSPYAVSKLAGEYYCRIFPRLFGLSTLSLRYFNVYGPRQDIGSEYAAVIPKFVTALLADTAPTIYGDGEQSRDFTYIDDCVQANLLAARMPGFSGEVVNIGYGARTTINDIYARIQRALGKEITPLFTSPRPGDVRHTLSDIRKARNTLNYCPKFDIEQGLLKTIAWYKEAVGGGGDRTEV